MASITCLVGGWLKAGVAGDLAMCLITQQASQPEVLHMVAVTGFPKQPGKPSPMCQCF